MIGEYSESSLLLLIIGLLLVVCLLLVVWLLFLSGIGLATFLLVALLLGCEALS